MKKILLVINLFTIGIQVLFANPNKSISFKIEFEFKNAEAREIYIHFIDFQRHQHERTISFKEPRFIFEDSISEPIRMTFEYKHERVQFFIEPGKTMQLIADPQNFSNSVLKGSLANDDYLELNKVSLDTTSLPSSIINSEDFDMKDMEKRKEFIVRHPNSFLSVWLLNGYFTHFGYEFSKLAYSRLDSINLNTNSASLVKKKLGLAEKSLAGSRVSNFLAENLDGIQISWNDIIKGHEYTLVDFWASWCGNCRDGSPFLRSIYSRYAGKGFTILSISLDKDRFAWKKAVVADSTFMWSHMIENNKKTIEHSLGVEDVPAFFIVDTNGKIIGRYKGGPLGEVNIRQKLKELFGN